LNEFQERNASFGKIQSWNGEERDASMGDFDRKYSQLPNDQLVSHLQRSVTSLKKKDSLEITGSFLQPLSGVYNSTDENQRDHFKKLAAEFADASSKLRINRSNQRNMLRKEARLKSDLTNLAITKEQTEIESSQHSEILTESAYGHSSIEVDEDCVIIGSSLQPVLKDIGQRKELIWLSNAMDESTKDEAKLSAESLRLINELSMLGCLSSSLERGCIDSGLCFINGRMSGLTKWNIGSISTAGRLMIPSAARTRKKIIYNYKLLWMVSGHALNPAYCTIIDNSGRFAITGADDYLVKVWDIEKGVLALTCRGHNGFISIIILSPDNSLLASACTLGVIRIWRLSDGRCIQVLKHGAKAVNWIAFDKTNCALASVGDEGNCIVWDLTKLLTGVQGEIPLLDVLKKEFEEKAVNHLQGMGNTHPINRSSKSFNNISIINNSNDLSQTSEDTTGNSSSLNMFNEELGSVVFKKHQESSDDSQGLDHIPFDDSPPLNSDIMSSSIYTEIDGSSTGSSNSNEKRQISNEQSNISSVISIDNEIIDIHTQQKINQPYYIEGIFDWNSHDESKLILPHKRDTSLPGYGAGSAEGIKLLCLDVSPLGGVLATGCEDGIIRMWKYGIVSTSAEVHKNKEVASLLSSRGRPVKGNDDSTFALSQMDMSEVYKLPRLEGHVAGVTDLRFSNEGDRIVSGSLLDGTVRIWSFTKDFSKNDHIVLVMADDDDEAVGNRGQGRRTVKGRGDTLLIYVHTHIHQHIYMHCTSLLRMTYFYDVHI
jgi:WD40 repeat protein